MNRASHNPFTLIGKRVLITGASSGIGRATAIECARMGAQCILTARNAERLGSLQSELEGTGHISILETLGTDDAAMHLVASLSECKLDGVVHCAGIDIRQPVQYVSEESFLETLRTNLMAPVFLNKRLIREKKLAKGASVVFISSIAATSPAMTQTTYAASKAAVISSMQVLAKEMKQKGIRSNCIAPGMVQTGMITATTLGISEEEFDKDKKRYIGNRYGTAKEVAHMVIYLLSDAAAWITGSLFKIDGGVSL